MPLCYMKTLADFTPEQLEEAIALKKQIATLESRLAALSGGTSARKSPTPSLQPKARPATLKRKRQMSAEGRAKIAAAAKARWAKAKAKGKNRL
jgi:hypothetical protein